MRDLEDGLLGLALVHQILELGCSLMLHQLIFDPRLQICRITVCSTLPHNWSPPKYLVQHNLSCSLSFIAVLRMDRWVLELARITVCGIQSIDGLQSYRKQ